MFDISESWISSDVVSSFFSRGVTSTKPAESFMEKVILPDDAAGILNGRMD
ncbi:MAG: hypothetical protein ACRD4W_04435 [Nitrososphaeraceae archaeon]